METKIIEINNEIIEKSERLKEITRKNFSMITIPQNGNLHDGGFNNKKINIPPISIIMYAIAFVSFICIFATNQTILYVVATIIFAFLGFRLSQNKNTEKHGIIIDKMQLKSEVSSKIVDSVKSMSEEWDEFIEIKQKELQKLIISSSMPEDKKDKLLSKIYLHEIIDISLSDLSQKINGIAQTASFYNELQNVIKHFLDRMLTAIDMASNKQIERYNSLLK